MQRTEWRAQLDTPRWREAGAIGLLALLAVGTVAPAFTGRVLFSRDINALWYAQIESFVKVVSEGSLPLWDRWRGFGHPLLADPAAQCLYPLQWLNLVMRPWTYASVYLASHLFLAGLGAYRWLRGRECARIAALVGGVGFMLGGPLMSLNDLWHHLAGASWAPWVLASADATWKRPTLDRLCWFSLVLALQMLAGSADMCASTLTLAALLAIGTPAASSVSRRLWSIFIGTLAALAIAAPLLFPAAELVAGSARKNLAIEARSSWSLHPRAVSTLVVPVAPASQAPPEMDTQTNRELLTPFLRSYYLGATLLPLGLLALVAGAPASRALGGAFALALLGALGRHTPIYALAVALVPPLASFRFPSKALITANLAIALLAGLGLSTWIEAQPAWRSRAGVVLGASSILAVACCVLTFPTHDGAAAWQVGRVVALMAVQALLLLLPGRQWRPTLILATCLLDLVSARGAAPLWISERLYRVRPPILASLPPAAGGERLFVYDYANESYPGQGAKTLGWNYPPAKQVEDWTAEQSRALGVQHYLNPPNNTRWQIPGSFDHDLLGLAPEETGWLNEVLRRKEGTSQHLMLLRLGAVRDVLAIWPAPWWQALKVEASTASVFEYPITLMAVPDPLPRAYVAYGVRVANGKPALRELLAQDFDPQTSVILAHGSAADAQPLTPARILHLDANSMQIEATALRAGHLVTVDALYPGWTAKLDGKPVQIERANLAFRAVAVPPGKHIVEFSYSPAGLRTGMALSLMTLLLLASCLAWTAVNGPRSTERAAARGQGKSGD